MSETLTHNNSYKKLAVQWFNETLYFDLSSVLTESLLLQNRQLLIAAKRYRRNLNAPNERHCKLESDYK